MNSAHQADQEGLVMGGREQSHFGKMKNVFSLNLTKLNYISTKFCKLPPFFITLTSRKKLF